MAGLKGAARVEQAFLDKHRKSFESLAADPTALYGDVLAREYGIEGAPDPQTGRKLAGFTNSLAILMPIEGAYGVISSDPQGWRYLWEATEAAAWDFRIQAVAYERDTRPERMLNAGIVVDFGKLLLAAHIGTPSAAADIAGILGLVSREDRCSHWALSASGLTFEARVYELVTGRPLDIDWTKLPALGGYEALLSPACVGAAFEQARDWACAEHMAQSVVRKKLPYPPFEGVPSRAMPLELILWLKVRKRAGLEHDPGDHPLLRSPLAELEPNIPSTPTPLWKYIEQALPHIRAYLRGSRFEDR